MIWKQNYQDHWFILLKKLLIKSSNWNSLNQEYQQRYEQFYERFCSWEDGNAAMRVVEAVFK